MNKYLPSKKFSLILLSIIVALGIIYGFSWFGKNKTILIKQGEIKTQTKVQEFMALDTDGDGMKDWEEALWKTDPKKADTDGDGTPDGEEIRLNRDPLKANTAPKGQEPNDKVDQKIITDNKKTEEEYAKLSNTDRLSRTLFSEYLATRKVGTALTATDKNNIVNNFIANMPEPAYTSNYSAKDIIINNNFGTSSVKAYGNQVAEIILQNFDVKTDDIYAIVTNYVSSEEEIASTEPLEKLSPIIAKNQKTITALLKLSVPAEAVNGHLILVNDFGKINQDLTTIKNSPKDIINTMVTLNQYDANAQNLSDILLNLTQYILSSKYNIQYAPTDFGYRLFMVQ